MKTVTKYICEVCHREYPTTQDALNCEFSQKHKIAAEERAKRARKMEKLKNEGNDVWYENGMKYAPTVDSTKFGPHKYADHDGTSDCQYSCGCWMGPCRSGGKVNPFGACPNNPKTIVELE